MKVSLFFFLFTATPEACGNSQARGQIRAAAYTTAIYYILIYSETLPGQKLKWKNKTKLVNMKQMAERW